MWDEDDEVPYPFPDDHHSVLLLADGRLKQVEPVPNHSLAEAKARGWCTSVGHEATVVNTRTGQVVGHWAATNLF
jgi:hypothetical protein